MRTFKINNRAISWNNKQYKKIWDESQNLDLCFCTDEEIYCAIMYKNPWVECFIEPAKTFNWKIIKYWKTEIQIKNL